MQCHLLLNVSKKVSFASWFLSTGHKIDPHGKSEPLSENGQSTGNFLD